MRAERKNQREATEVIKTLTSAALQAEQERRRGAMFTVPAHDVGPTPTLTSAGLTDGAE